MCFNHHIVFHQSVLQLLIGGQLSQKWYQVFTTNNIPVPDPPLPLTTRKEIQLVVRWIPSYHHQNFSPHGIFQQQRIKHEWLMTCLFAFLVVSMAAMKWHSQQFGKQCYGFNIKYFTTHYWWRTSKMSCFSGNLFLFFFFYGSSTSTRTDILIINN